MGTDNTDGNGHGTHVAGTIGGVTYGVAKKTKIFGVKVLADDGNGSYASIVAGMDFIIKDSATTARKAACPKGFVVNISIGGPYSSAVNAAAAAMVKKNIFVAVAAGNDAQDATNHSPASEPLVCTVGAISKGDSLAPYSNFGSLVDVFAPGTAVKSAWIGNSVVRSECDFLMSPDGMLISIHRTRYRALLWLLPMSLDSRPTSPVLLVFPALKLCAIALRLQAPLRS